MQANHAVQLKKFLTGIYLFSALTVTVATSKAGGPAVEAMTITAGTTNYSVQTNCPNSPDVKAMRVVNSTIVQTLDSSGTLSVAPGIDMRQLGFPRSNVSVGLNQTSISTPRKCTIRTLTTQPNPNPDAASVDTSLQTSSQVDPSASAKYHFHTPGQLTTALYDCYDGANYVCSTSLAELPAGDLAAVASGQN